MATTIHYRILKLSGLFALTRQLRQGALILCYHNVVAADQAPPNGDPGLHMPLPRFRSQMRWLGGHYEMVSLAELMDRLRSKRRVGSLATVTFDDGYAGVFTHALPVLRDLGIPAAVFVVANVPATCEEFWWDHPAVTPSLSHSQRQHWLETLRGDGKMILSTLGAGRVDRRASDLVRPADWATIAAAARSGVTVGVHSASHRVLSRLSDAELRDEVVTARTTIGTQLGSEPELFAYPYGLWTDRVRQAVAAAGYRAAVTLNSGLNTKSADPMALRRLNVPAQISDAAFEAWTAGLRLSWRRQR